MTSAARDTKPRPQPLSGHATARGWWTEERSCAEVAVALEEAFAGNAVAIGVLLAAVLVQAKLVL